jgi:twinkle protein
MDQHAKLFPGEFMVVTGIPGHGKSTWVLNLVVNLGERYGWRSAIFSPEMPTVPQLRDKLRRIVLRQHVMDLDRRSVERADTWIDRMLVFIDADPTGRSDDDFDLDWILDRATDAVLRDGINLLIIDPWNEIEHARKANESMTDYIGRAIRAIKRFAQLYGIAVIVIAHPTKDVFKEGKNRPVTLYDIEGSAHWFNKCDHGIVVDRPDPARDEALIRISKVRFEASGETGAIRLSYDRFSGRFDLLDALPSANVAETA